MGGEDIGEPRWRKLDRIAAHAAPPRVGGNPLDPIPGEADFGEGGWLEVEGGGDGGVEDVDVSVPGAGDVLVVGVVTVSNSSARSDGPARSY